MFWGILVAAVVLVIIGLLVWAVMWDSRMKATAERERLNREHELALADREAAVWQAAMESPSPSIFQHRRAFPEFLGHSQVIASRKSDDEMFAEIVLPRPTRPPAKPLDSRSSVETPEARQARFAERAQEIRETGTTEAALESGISRPVPGMPVEQCDRTEPHEAHAWTRGPDSDDRWCKGLEAAGEA